MIAFCIPKLRGIGFEVRLEGRFTSGLGEPDSAGVQHQNFSAFTAERESISTQ
jgi:hypothetical protein